MALKKWLIPSAENNIAGLADQLGCGRILAGVLLSRGIKTVSEAQKFIYEGDSLPDPMSIKDMDKAVERIHKAIDDGERIEIFGDYDVDGITSTALLFEYLESCGADIYCSLPVRDGDGYGLSNGTVDRMAADGVSLIITVDNGVSAVESIERAREHGIDVVVTDHHKVPEVLPNAVAVVDPLRQDDESGLNMLAGVGVALNLVAALDECTVPDMIEMYGMYAAMGTVSDVMPLVGENRYIVKHGLIALRNTDNLGLNALADVCSVSIESMDEKSIAFSFAPRLNAAGRMATADVALELLLTDDPDRANELANELAALNTKRQQIEKEMTELIDRQISEDHSYRNRLSLVFASEEFCSGVSGIVCSKLAEKYKKPSMIISIGDGEGKGSGRGYGTSSLYDAILSVSDILSRFGGHDMAAGFNVPPDNIEEFKERVEHFYREKAKEVSEEVYRIDYVTDFSELNEKEVTDLQKLAPFGASNPDPVLATLGAKVEAVTVLNDKHTRVTLSKNGVNATGIIFSRVPNELPYKVGDLVDAAYNVSIYATQRANYVSYRILEVRPAGIPDSSIHSYAGYCAMKAGGALPEFKLCRDTVGEIYKEIRRRQAIKDNDEAIAFIFSNKDLGIASAAIDVLGELGLLERKCSDGCRYIVPVVNPDKKDLADSRIFNLLS